MYDGSSRCGRSYIRRYPGTIQSRRWLDLDTRSRTIDRDVLIAVLQKENLTLHELTKLQAEQLQNYREQVEGYRHLQTSVTQVEDTAGKLVEKYEGRVQLLEKLVGDQEQQINALEARMNELETAGATADAAE